MRRLPKLTALLASCLLATGIVVGTAQAHAEITPPSGSGWAELYNPLLSLIDGKYHICLDVPDGTNDPTPLQMYHCHGYDSNGAPQRWLFRPNGDGTYRIANQGSHLCVTVHGNGFISDHGLVGQDPCSFSHDGQDWQLVEFVPGRSFQLKVAHRLDLESSCMSIDNDNHSRVFWRRCAWHEVQIFALG